MAEEKKKAEEEKKFLEKESKGNTDKKIPPPTDKLYSLLFDEIEHSPITCIGVDKVKK